MIIFVVVAAVVAAVVATVGVYWSALFTILLYHSRYSNT